MGYIRILDNTHRVGFEISLPCGCFLFLYGKQLAEVAVHNIYTRLYGDFIIANIG